MKILLPVILILSLLLCSCKEEQIVPITYEDIYYKGICPVEVSVDSSQNSIEHVKKDIRLKYPVLLGDTLNVHILEFQDDVYALDYYLNSGRFQGSAPILRGDFIEQSIRADSKIFIFNHDSFRRYERGDLEAFVRTFPEYRGGFPQEFLSLPFDKRVNGKVSIQTKYFLGIPATFPVLVQGYQDDGLQWNVARSWDIVEQSDFDKWSSSLTKVNPKGIPPQSDCVYFTPGEGIVGIASRLAGGRIVIVWGYLDWFDLERKFFTASDRIYEARF